ncbi:MAG: transglutaminase family protein [Cyanobacteria bacterium P01_C01_bin.89]
MKQAYLQATDVIDWDYPSVRSLAQDLGNQAGDDATAIAQMCFEWVRDQIRHSFDYQANPITCRASDVLKHKTGYCFAKSHLLAALLRANSIPAGFCYQRLSFDDKGAPYTLHGFNGVHLPKIGWYRMDARGNREGVDAQFTPPIEQLAFSLKLPEEADFPAVLPNPLPVIVRALDSDKTWDTVLSELPDLCPAEAEEHRLNQLPAKLS